MLRNFAADVLQDPIVSKIGHVTAAISFVSPVVNDFFHIIPMIGAFILWVFGCTWYGIQIYESKTGKALIAWFRTHVFRRHQ